MIIIFILYSIPLRAVSHPISARSTCWMKPEWLMIFVAEQLLSFHPARNRIHRANAFILLLYILWSGYQVVGLIPDHFSMVYPLINWTVRVNALIQKSLHRRTGSSALADTGYPAWAETVKARNGKISDSLNSCLQTDLHIGVSNVHSFFPMTGG